MEFQVVEVEGLGEFEFPTTMSDDEIASVIESEFSKPSSQGANSDIPRVAEAGPEAQVGSAINQLRTGALQPPPVDPRAQSIRETFGENTRAGTLAMGGMAGAEIANRRLQGFDPRLRAGGALVGGAIGTAAASLGNDIIRETPTQESVLNAAREGGLDATFSLAVPAALRSLGALGRGAGRALGVDDQLARQLIDTSEKIGAKVGTIDLSRFAPVKGVKTVLGVFPFVGGGFQKAGKQSRAAVVESIDRNLNAIAPNASLAAIGVDMTKAAENSFGEFKRVSGDLYQAFDDAAEAAGAAVPTQTIKQAAVDASGRVELPALNSGELSQGGNQEIQQFLVGLQDVAEDSISIQELRGIQRRISELFEIDALPNTDKRRLMILKQGTEQALQKISSESPEATEQLLSTLEKANGFYAAGMKNFENPTASRFGRVDKNLFRAGSFKAANLNPDEIAEVAINFRSPEAVRDLKALVGQENVHKAFRAHLQRSIDGAIDVAADGTTSFNFNTLYKAFGKGPNKTVSEDAVSEALKGTDVAPKDFLEVLKLAENLGKVPVPSTFLARRATLGGHRALLKGITGIGLTGIATSTDPVSAVVAFGFARTGARLLQSQRFLKAISAAKEPGIKDASQEIHLTRAVSAILDLRPTSEF